MDDRYVVEIDGEDAGILAREAGAAHFMFHAAHERFRTLDRRRFATYRDAERAAKALHAVRRDEAARRERA